MWYVKNWNGSEISTDIFDSYNEALDVGIEILKSTRNTVSIKDVELTNEQFHNNNNCRYCAEGVSHHHNVCGAGILNDTGRFSVL